MTYFFGISRHQDNGLSDATNLLSTRSVKREQPASLQFSARRFLCFAGGTDRSIGEMESPIQKNFSPSPEVAAAWIEMETACDKSSSSSSKPPTERSSATPTTTTSTSRDGSITTQPASSRRIPYCGARRMPPTESHSRRPQRPFSSGGLASSVTRRSTRMGQWKSAVDPKSGRTYYYNERTRETQWRKPMELASPTERKEMALKERNQKEFFAAMERNILRNIAQGQVPGTPTEDKKVPSAAGCSPSSALKKPSMVRTISGMNDSILRELVKRVPSTRTTKMPREQSSEIGDLMMMKKMEDLTVLKESDSNGSTSHKDTGWADLDFDVNDDSSPSAREESRVLQELAKTAEQMTLVSGSVVVTPDEATMPQPKSPGPERPVLQKPGLGGRRNTCGTIYVGTTMSAPDKDATIKCVCGVYRAHILSQESFPTRMEDAKYRIFNDHEADRITFIREDVEMEDTPCHIPSLQEITNFYRDVFRRAQMESDTIIMSLNYVERLIKVTNGGLRPTPRNWRSLLFSCMVLSSKVWDDLSMWNADFSQTRPSRVKFSLSRINELELAVLNALSYQVKVPASEYAKYYFLLRSMLIKSGLGGDDLKTRNPLDVEGAKQLEQVSSSFQATAATKQLVAQQDLLRSKSVGYVDSQDTSQGQDKKASLEHMVKM